MSSSIGQNPTFSCRQLVMKFGHGWLKFGWKIAIRLANKFLIEIFLKEGLNPRLRPSLKHFMDNSNTKPISYVSMNINDQINLSTTLKICLGLDRFQWWWPLFPNSPCSQVLEIHLKSNHLIEQLPSILSEEKYLAFSTALIFTPQFAQITQATLYQGASFFSPW